MTSTTRPSAAPVPVLCPGRRTFLVGAASVAGVGVLAACAPAADEGSEDPAGAPGSTPSERAGDQAGGQPVPLVAAADVPVGGAVSATTSGGDEIIVAQPEEGTFVAFSAICTHKGCVVEPDGAELACPCHGSVFEAATGRNVSGPAPTPLPSVAVTVEDGQVLEA